MRLKAASCFVFAWILGCSSGQEHAAPPASPTHATTRGAQPRSGTRNDADAATRVFFDLARHVDRAELWHRRTLLVDHGTTAGAKYTLGGWTTSLAHGALDGSSVAWSTDTRGCFYVSWDGEGPAALVLRGRAFRNDPIAVDVNGNSIGELRLPADGTYAVARLQVPEAHLERGENAVVLRVRRLGSTPNVGRVGVAVDWMRFGPASEGNDETPPPASLRAGNEDDASLLLPASFRVGYTLEVPSGARLRARVQPARGATLTVVAQRDGQQAMQIGRVTASGTTEVDIPLDALEGNVARLELEANGGPVRLQRPAIVVPTVPQRTLARHPRNVIVYLIDTLRADKLQPINGESRVRTPGLDRFAQEAATFTRAHTQENWTKPSVATLLSSLMPWEHTATQGDSVVPASVELLPEVLEQGGFFTGAFIANGYVSDRFGFKQGWGTYRNYIREERRTVAESVANDVIAWLEARPQEKPFFAYIHTIDPHVPYRPPPEFLRLYGSDGYRGPVDFRRDATLLENIKVGRLRLGEADKRHLEALYDGEITYHDVHFDRIVAELRRRDLWNDTMIVITADHGEEFWDHGSVGHGHNVYEELLHIPMFVRVPGLTDDAARIDDPVGLVDVMPTILEALGRPASGDASGRSFLRLLAGTGEDAPRVTVSGFMDNWRTIVVGRWKLIERARGALALHDLVTDPGERENVADRNPIAVRYTRGLLGMELARTARALTTPSTTRRDTRAPRRHEAQETEIDPETEAQLRALGYVH